MVDLILPMKGVYFDQILRGEKLEEYRLRTSYWEVRLADRKYGNLVLLRGYPKGGGVEGVTRLTMPYRGYTMRQLQHPHFGPEPVNVFAIKAHYCPNDEDKQKGIPNDRY